MNVYKCSGQTRGTMRCIYQDIEVDQETGDLIERGCLIKQRDHYNVYPEFSEGTGNVVRQNGPTKCLDGHIIPDTELDPLGPTIIWENIAGQHDHGLTFNYRRFSPYEHPRYHLAEFNIPTRHGPLDPDTVADIFGESSLTLVSSGWHDDKSYGKPTVERCNMCLFGRFDRLAGLTVHRAMRSYSGDVSDWVNYTNLKERVRRKYLFLLDANLSAIEQFCIERFEGAAVNRMIDIMRAVKEGHYINLREAAMNNGMTQQQASTMMQEISIKSKKTIYSGTVNLQRLYELYAFVDRMNVADVYAKVFRCNIINYLLNFPKLMQIDPTIQTEFKTNQRYWFAYLMVKRAFVVDRILDVKTLPFWFVHLLHKIKNHKTKFSVLGKIYATDEVINEVFDDFVEAQSYYIRDVTRLFPAMCSVDSLLEEYNTCNENKKKTFNNILKAGVKWNITEVQTVWKKFTKCFDKNQPRLFWNFIDEMDELDYKTLSERITGEGNPGMKKACFINLVKARTEFRDEDSWNVSIPELMPVNSAGAKHKAKFRQRKMHFWIELMKIGGLKGDKRIDTEFISDDKIQQLIDQEQEKDELEEMKCAPSDEPIIDGDDYEDYSEFDPSTGMLTPLISRGSNDSWEEGENNG